MKIRIGNEDPDSLITYPDTHNLSGCAQPIRMRTYPDTRAYASPYARA